MKQILLWLWCLPQNLVGLLVRLFTRARKVGDHYEYNREYGSVSLGEFIFLSRADADSEFVLAHELGHRKQSRRLGWLYLIIIGLPSLIWAGCFGWYRRKHGINYYEFYTEKWANKLGGVEKNK